MINAAEIGSRFFQFLSLGRRTYALLPILLTAVCAFEAMAQVSQSEHESHHPDQAQSDPAASAPAAGQEGPGPNAPPDSGGMMGGGGMGGMMDGMMEKMGAPAPKQLYPSLMSLPDLPLEQRDEVKREAHERMKAGVALMSQGLDALSRSAPTDDFAAMQSATATLREGLSQFESGLAAHRALAEGKAPRNVALNWFRREMNLLPPAAADRRRGPLGLSWLHFIVMLLLGAFAAAMIAMYFFKMRRTAALLKQIAASSSARARTEPAPPDVNDGKPVKKTNAAASVSGDCCSEESGDCESTALPAGADLSRGLLSVAERKLCRLRVARIVQETEDVKTFRFVACHGGGIPFSYLPGQFLTLTLPLGDKPIRRSYTMSSSPTQGYYCEITVKREERGAGSRYLHDNVHVGDTLEVKAPSGKFYFKGDESDGVVLIGGGVGITPMVSIVRALTDMAWPGEIYLIAACQDPEHFIFKAEIERLESSYDNLHVFAAMSRIEHDTGRYRKGRLTGEMLAEWVPDLPAKWVHLCGAPPMMDATKEMLAELGVPEDRIHTENFGSTQKPKAKVAEEQEEAVEARKTAQSGTVSFTASDVSTPLQPDETVLEAAERVDVDIDYSCRVGTCGECKVKLLSGEVTMEEEDGLDPGDKEQGMILACQAKADRDIAVEA